MILLHRIVLAITNLWVKENRIAYANPTLTIVSKR